MDFIQNEEEIERELLRSKQDIESKNKAIDREEQYIKELHGKLEKMEKEKVELEEEIGEYEAELGYPQSSPSARNKGRLSAAEQRAKDSVEKDEKYAEETLMLKSQIKEKQQ